MTAITLNRLGLWESPLTAVDERRDGAGGSSVTLAGQESAPPLTVAQLTARHDDLLELAGRELVAVTFGLKDDRDGFYRVASAGSALTRHTSVALAATWRLELERWGRGPADVELEAALVGALRSNAHPTTSGGGSIWHAPPVGHFAYHHATASPTTLGRVGQEGTVTVYRGLLAANGSPRWLCNAGHYVSGGCRITADGLVRSGLYVPGYPSSWSMGNTLVRIGQASAGAELLLEVWDSGAWVTLSERLRVAVGFGARDGTTSDAFTVLRNDPEVTAVRLLWDNSPARTTLDLTLRRGARHLACVIRHRTTDTLGIQLYDAGSAATADQGGWVERASDDANGNRWVIGTARPVVGVSSGSYRGIGEAAVATFAGYVGCEFAGSAAVAGDGGGDLLAQYVEDRAEFVRAVPLR